MTAIPLRDESLQELKDKVVVITGKPSLFAFNPNGFFLTQFPGSAHGIGLSTVHLLHSHGAKVVHGDWDSISGSAIDTSLPQSSSSSPSPSLLSVIGGETTFVKTDVTSYLSILNLFEVAREKYGRVDIAISNAGITEKENWFDPSLDLESIRTVFLPVFVLTHFGM
jgi:NAD(P)-dependent dehydrogenase (short-subunit alcohol dehydrogenase family)